MKKVSIVMPVYNGKEFLSESIESIINQSYTNWEFVIVNEFGSNDGSKEIIEEYAKKDKRIKFIQNEKREGISASLNIALKNSTGEYIARMDSDDISGKYRLEKQVEYLENNKNIGLCGIQPKFIGTEKINWKLETNHEQIKHNIFFYTPCVHPTIMFRRELLDKHNIFYDESFKATEDYEFFSRVVGVTNIVNIDDESLFQYRMYPTNATNRNNEIGLELYNKVMKNCFSNYLNLEFTEDEIKLLDSHISTGDSENEELYEKIVTLDLLLKKILVASLNQKKFKKNYLFKTLNKRWNELKWSIKENKKTPAINNIIEKSIFNNSKLQTKIVKKEEKPEITVLMPVYNSENYIIDSVNSILNQTYQNFELLIIVEYGTSDNTLEYLKVFDDPRIKIVINNKKLGLAASLNKGIKMCKTKYIARMDSDDLSLPDRLEKQYDYLEKNKDVALVCSWQRHFGSFGTYIHNTESSSDDLKASLLFKCDVCHSTVMFRTKTMIDNNYFYDENRAMEDFDLWNRMLEKENLYCIPEVLGEYRIHGDNITAAKFNKVIESEISIIGRSLENLKINKNSYNNRLLIGWENIYNNEKELIKDAEELFERIIKQNNKIGIYNEKSLLKAINKRRNWMYGTEDYIKEERPTEKIGIKTKLKRITKKMVKPFIKPIYSRLMYRINNMIKENNDNLSFNLENFISNKLENNNEIINDKIRNNQDNVITYVKEEFVKNNNRFEIIKKENDNILSSIKNLEVKGKDIENSLEEIKKTQKEINDKIDYQKTEFDFYKDIFLNNFYFEKKIVLIGTSEHNNIGDSAITIGEYAFIKKYFPDHKLMEVSTYEYDRKKHYIEKVINNEDLILLQGGGNLGNRYLGEENVRRDVIESFPNNKIVILPQTIYFEDTKEAEKELKISQSIYNKHKNLTIFVRGNVSYKNAKEYFYNAKIYESLDMALINNLDYKFERNGILTCIRDINDEGGLSKENHSKIFEIVKEFDKDYYQTENIYKEDIVKEKRNSIVNMQLKIFAKHKLVITDRLHGLIFALMTNTPCIVLSSYNYKLNEFTEMLKDNKFIKFIDKDIDKLKTSIEEFNNMKINNYENNYSENFEKISKIIKENK